MDWKQFIASIISNLSWPSVAIIILFMFKTELAKIVERLTHLKYKDIELDFEKVKQQAEVLHEEFFQEEATVESPIFTSLEDQIMEAVESSPSAAILLAWSGLETAIASAVSRLEISQDSPFRRSPIHNIEALKKQKRLSNTHLSLLHEMRILRNKVAHERDSMLSVSQEQASNYADTAIHLIKHFEKYEKIG